MIHFVLYFQPAISEKLKPDSIQKFQEQVPVIPRFVKKVYSGKTFINISAEQVQTQILPKRYLKTKTSGYSGLVQVQGQQVYLSTSPGPTIQIFSHQQVYVQVQNKLGSLKLPADQILVDQKIRTQIRNNCTPAISHFHGCQTDPKSDGHAMAYCSKRGVVGPEYKPVISCPNDTYIHRLTGAQGECFLFYHDHTMGLTRINVYNGLFGAFVIRDISPKFFANIKQTFLVIYDRSFNQDGSLFYQKSDKGGWVPQHYGDFIVVNGKVWPKMSINGGVHRLRMLNAANSRYFNFAFKTQKGSKLKFDLVGNQQGYIPAPVQLEEILVGPGMRIDIIIDFSQVQGSVTLENDAKSPYPDGDDVDNHTSKVIKFNIKSLQEQSRFVMPATLRPAANLAQGRYKQLYVLIEKLVQQKVDGMFLNGVDYHNSYDSNSYFVNETTQIYIINLTPDAHPFHIHLAGFQAVEECDVLVDQYRNEFLDINGLDLPFNHSPAFPQHANYVRNCTRVSERERGWRDTINVNPNKMLRLRFRLSRMSFNEIVPYDFDITSGYYLVHCHILQHEDKQMMQNFVIHRQNYQNMRVTSTKLLQNQLIVEVQRADSQKVMNDSGLRFEYNGKTIGHTRTVTQSKVIYRVGVGMIDKDFKQIEMILTNRKLRLGARDKSGENPVGFMLAAFTGIIFTIAIFVFNNHWNRRVLNIQ